MTRFLLLLLVALSAPLSAQLNTILRDNLPYDTGVNDIWGYVAPDGTEYAIVGLVDGVSFVSLADPDNVVEVARIPGNFSNWRDMKTYGEYAYSVADQSNSTEGITAFDLTELPERVTFQRNTYNIPGESVRFVRSHNLFIDTLKGIIFTAGGTRDLRDGGIFMFDVTEDPMSPRLIGQGPPIYSHDVFVLNDTMYASELYLGELAIYNVADLDNIVEIGRTRTPFRFTHNAWTTITGRYVFTTDERANAPVAAYDLSDPNDIQLLDEYRPAGSLNSGTIPHNAHVIGDFLSISYYTDGLRVVDAADPSNLIEVANYDTWLGPDGDFNGAWGAYPFLPSGLTLVSDRQSGLFVIEVDYKEAARLEGTVTDGTGGFPLNRVDVTINTPEDQVETTDPLGRYNTGLADAGTYSVEFAAQGYRTVLTDINLTNGETVLFDTSLIQADEFPLTFTVVDDVTGAPIEGARVQLMGRYDDYGLVTNETGSTGEQDVFENESFTLIFSSWGYVTQVISGAEVDGGNFTGLEVRMARGFKDDFIADQGWTTSSTAPTGQWVRAKPIGTIFNGNPSAPGADVSGDLGEEAYVTGNAPGGAGEDDVDDGSVTLESPAFGPLADNTEDIIISYSYWFTNQAGDPPVNDVLTVSITNGTETVLAREYRESRGEWLADSFSVTDFLPLSDQLQLIITTADQVSTGHLLEGGFDNFQARDVVGSTATETFFDPTVEVVIYPNPTAGEFNLQFDVSGVPAPTLRITDASGRIVGVQRLRQNSGVHRFGNDLPKGFYLFELLDGDRRLWVGKAIKK